MHKFFSGKKIFFPTDRPQKISECYMKRQYFFVPPKDVSKCTNCRKAKCVSNQLLVGLGRSDVRREL